MAVNSNPNASFFAAIRPMFGGRMTAEQVSGVEKIITYRDTSYRGVTNDQLAYILATVFHETARKCIPITEMGSQAYLRSKKYYPWIGRGLIQCTWEVNYKRYNCTKPEDALQWDMALKMAFDGMVCGRFTGKKLSQYISGGSCDFIGARRIINGTDRASLIAGYAKQFQSALLLWNPKPVVAVAKARENKSVFDSIGGFFDNIFGAEERPASPDAPMPKPLPAPLTGTAGYTVSAIVAVIGALQLLDWNLIVSNPSVGYHLIVVAVVGAVGRSILPSWLWFVIPYAQGKA